MENGSLYQHVNDNYPLYNYFIDLYFKISFTVFFQTPEFQFYTTAITSPVISANIYNRFGNYIFVITTNMLIVI
jgi:hypothetical protein